MNKEPMYKEIVMAFVMMLGAICILGYAITGLESGIEAAKEITPFWYKTSTPTMTPTLVPTPRPTQDVRTLIVELPYCNRWDEWDDNSNMLNQTFLCFTEETVDHPCRIRFEVLPEVKGYPENEDDNVVYAFRLLQWCD